MRPRFARNFTRRCRAGGRTYPRRCPPPRGTRRWPLPPWTTCDASSAVAPTARRISCSATGAPTTTSGAGTGGASAWRVCPPAIGSAIGAWRTARGRTTTRFTGTRATGWGRRPMSPSPLRPVSHRPVSHRPSSSHCIRTFLTRNRGCTTGFRCDWAWTWRSGRCGGATATRVLLSTRRCLEPPGTRATRSTLGGDAIRSSPSCSCPRCTRWGRTGGTWRWPWRSSRRGSRRGNRTTTMTRRGTRPDGRTGAGVSHRAVSHRGPRRRRRRLRGTLRRSRRAAMPSFGRFERLTRLRCPRCPRPSPRRARRPSYRWKVRASRGLKVRRNRETPPRKPPGSSNP
mmetsp:Transcript_9189/g.35798  ORF Transcript_9189/g.35798 Transcript_9189/m.35798 type:complete len:342 (-) Transcript_9189:2388-3413(-)